MCTLRKFVWKCVSRERESAMFACRFRSVVEKVENCWKNVYTFSPILNSVSSKHTTLLLAVLCDSTFKGVYTYRHTHIHIHTATRSVCTDMYACAERMSACFLHTTNAITKPSMGLWRRIFSIEKHSVNGRDHKMLWVKWEAFPLQYIQLVLGNVKGSIQWQFSNEPPTKPFMLPLYLCCCKHVKNLQILFVNK